jgi:hypothetical protein
VVLGQTLAGGPALSVALTALGWGLWFVFLAEFVLRLYVAPDRGASSGGTGGRRCSRDLSSS